MALWVFGCSFSVEPGEHTQANHPAWTDILASNMGLANFHRFSQWGVSNEYIIDQFMLQIQNIQAGDTVIIQLTEKSRQWFFKDQPCLGNIYISNLEQHVPIEQKKAVDMYIKHLDRDDIQTIRYTLLCMALRHVSEMRQDFKIMILPGFNYVPGVVGSLLEICNGEFVSSDSFDQWYATYPIDKRINHMSPNNHKILADKISQTFNTGKILDLTTGFDKGFL
jgi:hypothetical protein